MLGGRADQSVRSEKKRGMWYWIKSAHIIPHPPSLLLTLALFDREPLLWLMSLNPERTLRRTYLHLSFCDWNVSYIKDVRPPYSSPLDGVRHWAHPVHKCESCLPLKRYPNTLEDDSEAPGDRVCGFDQRLTTTEEMYFGRNSVQL